MVDDIPTEINHLVTKRRRFEDENSDKKFKQAHYSESVKSFALTLHGYSPKAYNYIRETFNEILPHEKTLTDWLSKLDVSPGFSQAALSHLKIISQSEAEKGKSIYCSLTLDEMRLKQHISFDGKVFHGGIDLGAGPSEYDDNPATDAYVMMMTALNGSWKIPIGYFFINSLSAIGTLSNHIHTGCPTFLAR